MTTTPQELETVRKLGEYLDRKARRRAAAAVRVAAEATTDHTA